MKLNEKFHYKNYSERTANLRETNIPVDSRLGCEERIMSTEKQHALE